MMQQRFPTIDPVQVLRKVGISMNAIEEILWNSSLSDGVKARIAKEGHEQGLAEGKAEGKAEGLVAGKAEALQSAIASFYSLQFSSVLPEDVRLRLASLSVEQLEDIVNHWPADTGAFLARLQHHEGLAQAK